MRPKSKPPLSKVRPTGRMMQPWESGDAWEFGLACKTDKTGARVPIASLTNGVTILVNDPAWRGVIARDTFANETIATRCPPWSGYVAPAKDDLHTHDARPWKDNDTGRLRSWLETSKYALPYGEEMMHRIVALVADTNEVHPVREYLTSVEWDCTERLDTWLSTYMGAEDDADGYVRMVARSIMISAVARARDPGCKVDTMAILVGPQGIKKSSAIKTLFGVQPGWYADSTLDLDSKDRFTNLAGKWCTEWAELDALKRARDAERVKAFLSSGTDTYRPPYGRNVVAVPRQGIFIGTTNEDEFLSDVTGLRRWHTVDVRHADLEGLAADRDQLWAEAVANYEVKQAWWPEGAEVLAAARAQQRHAQVDAWTSKIESYLVRKSTKIGRTTVPDILGNCFGIEPGKWTRADQMRVAACLVTLGYRRKRLPVQPDKTQPWVYDLVPVLEVVPKVERTLGTSAAAETPVVLNVPNLSTERGREVLRVNVPGGSVGSPLGIGNGREHDADHEAVASLFGGTLDEPSPSDVAFDHWKAGGLKAVPEKLRRHLPLAVREAAGLTGKGKAS